MRGATRLLVAALACAAVLGGLAAASAPPAAAHAALESSTPAAGATLSQAPADLVLTFGEPPDPALSMVALVEANGLRVPVSAPQTVPGDPLSLRVTLSRALGKGVYSVNWRSVSATDGHVDTGVYAFGVGVPVTPGTEVKITLTHTTAWAQGMGAVGRWVLYAGLLLFVGAASTCVLVLKSRLPSGGVALTRVALLLAAVGLALMVWSERDLVGAPRLLPLFETPEGVLLLYLGVALLFCAAAVVAVDVYPARVTLLVLGASGLVAVLVHVLAGHADAPSAWRVANIIVQWIHMSAIGVWVGGLAWLLLGIRAMGKEERAAAVATFSGVATVTLVVVLASGLIRGVEEVRSVGALVDTAYGITLLVKVGLVVVLVALGALNHFRWVPALRAGDGAARSFRLNSTGELALATAVLLATAILTGLVPAATASGTAVAQAGPGVRAAAARPYGAAQGPSAAAATLSAAPAPADEVGDGS
jgi:copper transport protein